MLSDFAARKKYRDGLDNLAYFQYVATPFSFGALTVDTLSTAFILPANGYFGVSCSEATENDDYSVFINGVEHSQSANLEDVINSLGFLYKPYSIQLKPKSGLPASTLGLYHYDYWKRPTLVASGTLS
jgi:hypothetical protein